MHTISFYTIRALKKKFSGDSYILGKLKDESGLSMYKTIKDYILNNQTETISDGSAKKTIFFNECKEITFDDKKNLIYGYVCVGKYGEVFEVVNKDSQERTYEGTVEDIYYNKRYIMIHVPDDLEEGYVAIHSVQKTNPKRTLFSHFKKMSENYHGLHIRFSPLLPGKIPEEVLNGKVAELRAINYNPHSDKSDALESGNPDIKNEFVMKGRNGALGKLRDFVPGGNKKNLVELLDQDSEYIKLSIEINGRTTIYNYHNILSKGITIPLEDKDLNISITTGIPNINSIHKIAVDNMNNIYGERHKGGEISIWTK